MWELNGKSIINLLSFITEILWINDIKSTSPLKQFNIYPLFDLVTRMLGYFSS